MKLFLLGNIEEDQSAWNEVISTNFPTLMLDHLPSIDQLAEYSAGERCLILSDTKEILAHFSQFLSFNHSIYSFVAVGDEGDIREILNRGLELAGTLIRPVSDDELIDYIQAHQLSNRPQEVGEDFFASDVSPASEGPMGQKDIEVDEIELEDDLEISIDGDDSGVLQLSSDDDLVLGDDDGELVLDSDIDSNIGELESESDKSGISFDLDSSSTGLTLGDDTNISDISFDDEDGVLDLSGGDQEEVADEEESEIDLSFGGLELSEESEEASDDDSLSFSASADGPEDEDEMEEEEIEEQNKSDASIQFNVSGVEEESSEADDDLIAPQLLESDEDEEDDDGPVGDSLDFTAEEDDNDGTAEFELDGSSEDDDEESIEGVDLLASDDEDETTDSIAIPNDLPEDDIPVPVAEKVQTKTFLNTSQDDPAQKQSVTHILRDKIDYNFDENEMVRLQVTLRGLKEEREKLLSTIEQQVHKIDLLEQNNLGLKAEVDDQQIEISLLKKRFGERNEEASYQVRLSEEKRGLYEEKMKKMQHEFDLLNQKVRLDLTRVKQREKELESQLELVKMDADAQIKGRDQKIMELKRKIDSLEFNMENIAIREQQMKEERVFVEAKVQKLMSTLKGSMKILEDDFDPMLKEHAFGSGKKDEDKI